MDITFRVLINKSIVVYLNDITVYSRTQGDHLPHLKAIFERCRRYRISLNPNKSIFSMEEGTFLKFVISPEGITIDLGRIESIKSIVFPHKKKVLALQCNRSSRYIFAKKRPKRAPRFGRIFYFYKSLGYVKFLEES